MKKHFFPLVTIWACFLTSASAQLVLNTVDSPNKKVAHTLAIHMMPGFKVSSINGSFYHAFIDANGDGIPDNPTPPTPPPINENENYIKSTEYLTEKGESGNKKVTIVYYDGLGREKQAVQVATTPSGKDIITHYEYDGLGRKVKDFLPVPSSGSEGVLITDPVSLYTAYYGNTQTYNTSYFYSEKELENSPLSRVMKQASPGDSWKLGSGHEVKFDYQTNVKGEVRYFAVNLGKNYSPSLTEKGTYGAGELYKTITKDENWKTSDQSDHITEEFKDKEGKVILRRTYNHNEKHDTYYVYDLYGNLTYVLPPLLVEQLPDDSSASTTPPKIGIKPPDTELPFPEIGINPPDKEIPLTPPPYTTYGDPSPDPLDNLSYQYRYDERNRLVEKKLPGKGWEYLVYDKQDRVVLTQDSEQRKKNRWLFVKYDKFGRVVYTGYIINTSNRLSLQANAYSRGANNETPSDTGFTAGGLKVFYDNKTAIPNGITEVLTVNYYDTYLNTGAPQVTSVEGQTVVIGTDIKLKGTLTGSFTKLLDGNTQGKGNWKYTYYDTKIRPVRIRTQNYLGGFTQTDSKLESFRGKTEYAITTHSRATSKAEITLRENYTYDKQERLLTHTHQVNGGKTEYLSQNIYDELGRVKNKKVGGLLPEKGLQQVDYKYNIRGWLTEVNNPKNLSPSNQPKDLFAFKLNYDQVAQGVSGNVMPLFNGNIAEASWVSASDNIQRGYGYKYDPMNRLLSAYYEKGENVTQAYDERISYDKNGNILSLKRYGEQDINMNTVLIDELAYSYSPSSNYLLGVKDISNHPAGFSQGKVNDNGYKYDTNGNMIQDLYKGISEISYNYLNLPIKITSTQGIIEYLYDATGLKLQKKVTEKKNNTVVVTDYSGGFQYTDTILQFFPQQEGYYDYVKKNYVYNYTDHLGNIRLSYNQNPANGSLEILEENHYYPFGMKHAGYANNTLQPTYQYKYNGKEFQNELNLNIYDYGARNYEPAIGRWFNTDPLAESMPAWSPYSYTFNNPLKFTDPTGMEPEDWVLGKNGIYWDNNANDQASTQAGDTYLGKELSFTFNSYIGSNYDGPLGSLPEGDKLTTTINLSATENNAGELTGLSATKTTEIGKTFGMFEGRDYYPGEGGSNNYFAKSGMSINYEQHASVPAWEEKGLKSMNFKIVDVAQKLNISFDKGNGNLSINTYTNIFPSATLKLNNTNTTIMNYIQPSFINTHTAPIIGYSPPSLKDNTIGGQPIRDFSYYPVKFYKR